MMCKLKIAEPYVPETIPDTDKIKECLKNIADEVVNSLSYCAFAYVVQQLNDIRIACGIDEQESENDVE